MSETSAWHAAASDIDDPVADAALAPPAAAAEAAEQPEATAVSLEGNSVLVESGFEPVLPEEEPEAEVAAAAEPIHDELEHGIASVIASLYADSRDTGGVVAAAAPAEPESADVEAAAHTLVAELASFVAEDTTGSAIAELGSSIAEAATGVTPTEPESAVVEPVNGSPADEPQALVALASTDTAPAEPESPVAEDKAAAAWAHPGSPRADDRFHQSTATHADDDAADGSEPVPDEDFDEAVTYRLLGELDRLWHHRAA